MGDSKSEIETSSEMLRLVARFLKKHELSFNPCNYSVAYSYLGRTYPALSLALEEFLGSKGVLNTSVLSEFYVRYLAPELVLPVLGRKEQMTKDVLDVVSEVMVALSATETATQKSQGTLVAQQNTLNKPGPLSASDIKEIVLKLVEETKKLVTTSTLMRKNLENNKAEVESLQRELAQHKDDAQTDPLTGLMNRRGFEEVIGKILAACETKNLECSFVLVDIDHFKKINDTFGHSAGDTVLGALADLFRYKTRGEDLLVRWGGEEFLVVLPETTAEKGHIVVENLRKQIEQLAVLKDPQTGIAHTVTFSAGIHSYRPGKNKGWQEVISCADKALYEAKNTGRNKTCFYFGA